MKERLPREPVEPLMVGFYVRCAIHGILDYYATEAWAKKKAIEHKIECESKRVSYKKLEMTFDEYRVLVWHETLDTDSEI